MPTVVLSLLISRLIIVRLRLLSRRLRRPSSLSSSDLGAQPEERRLSSPAMPLIYHSRRQRLPNQSQLT